MLSAAGVGYIVNPLFGPQHRIGISYPVYGSILFWAHGHCRCALVHHAAHLTLTRKSPTRRFLFQTYNLFFLWNAVKHLRVYTATARQPAYRGIDLGNQRYFTMWIMLVFFFFFWFNNVDRNKRNWITADRDMQNLESNVSIVGPPFRLCNCVCLSYYANSKNSQSRFTYTWVHLKSLALLKNRSPFSIDISQLISCGKLFDCLLASPPVVPHNLDGLFIFIFLVLYMKHCRIYFKLQSKVILKDRKIQFALTGYRKKPAVSHITSRS